MNFLLKHSCLLLLVNVIYAAIPEKKVSKTKCEPPNDNAMIWTNNCAEHPDLWIGLSTIPLNGNQAREYCRGIGARIISNYNFRIDMCVANMLTEVALAEGESQQALIGAKFENMTQAYAWSDGIHKMENGDDYTKCSSLDETGICTRSLDNKGYPKECLIAKADYSKVKYLWKSYSCLSSSQFICEYRCDMDFPIFNSNHSVAYVGQNASADGVFVNQIANGTLGPLQKLKFPVNGSSIPVFPYITYNYDVGALEVVGTFTDTTLNWHYYMFLNGSYSGVWNSLYDKRYYAGFLYVPEWKQSVFIGGTVSSTRAYSTKAASPGMLYSTSDFNNDIKLPGLPNQGSIYSGTGLTDMAVKYHGKKIYMLGGLYWGTNKGAYYYKTIWTMDVTNTTGLSWDFLPNLQYATARAGFSIIDNLLFTTGDSFHPTKGLEVYDLNSERSFYYPNAFNCTNDSPMSFVNDGRIVFVGGVQREIKAPQCECNTEWTTFEKRNSGFVTEVYNNFPNELLSKQSELRYIEIFQ